MSGLRLELNAENFSIQKLVLRLSESNTTGSVLLYLWDNEDGIVTTGPLRCFVQASDNFFLKPVRNFQLNAPFVLLVILRRLTTKSQVVGRLTNELEGIWKDAVVDNSRNYAGTCLERLQ
jgi:hypothetical protein